MVLLLQIPNRECLSVTPREIDFQDMVHHKIEKDLLRSVDQS